MRPYLRRTQNDRLTAVGKTFADLIGGFAYYFLDYFGVKGYIGHILGPLDGIYKHLFKMRIQCYNFHLSLVVLMLAGYSPGQSMA
jgi:hypothetical protein